MSGQNYSRMASKLGSVMNQADRIKKKNENNINKANIISEMAK
jgi:hypothetical protein